MREDNMFYIKPKKAVATEKRRKQERETVSYEELYEQWLLPKLLSTPPMKLYPKPLVDFAELVLSNPGAGQEWLPDIRPSGVETLLGFCLDKTAETGETREFSSVAMQFVGAKYELAYVTSQYIDVDQMCTYMISFFDLDPVYFRVIRKGGQYILKGTKMFYRESGLKVWLEYDSIYGEPLFIGGRWRG